MKFGAVIATPYSFSVTSFAATGIRELAVEMKYLRLAISEISIASFPSYVPNLISNEVPDGSASIPRALTWIIASSLEMIFPVL